MSSTVAAAIIAASVSFLTLIGTLAAQYFGRRATRRDLKEQGERLRRHRQITRRLTDCRRRSGGSEHTVCFAARTKLVI